MEKTEEIYPSLLSHGKTCDHTAYYSLAQSNEHPPLHHYGRRPRRPQLLPLHLKRDLPSPWRALPGLHPLPPPLLFAPEGGKDGVRGSGHGVLGDADPGGEVAGAAGLKSRNGIYFLFCGESNVPEVQFLPARARAALAGHNNACKSKKSLGIAEYVF